MDNVTRACLLHSQSTGEPPNHITKPLVDRKVFRQSANEESAAAFKGTWVVRVPDCQSGQTVSDSLVGETRAKRAQKPPTGR